jgi:hypothetical protein
MGVSPVDPSMHRCIGAGWATWSHGYRGDVYFTGGATSQTITLPAGTKAFYMYVEPNPFDTHTFEVLSGGATSGPFTVVGDSGARYVGIYDDGGGTLGTVTIRCDVDFASGEFGWAGGEPQKSCIKGIVKDGATGAPLEMAFMIAVQLPSRDIFWALTGPKGDYMIECPDGLYIVIAVKRPYQTAWQIVKVPPGECAIADFMLKK